MVSRYPLGQRVKERIYGIFLETLADLSTSKDVGDFLEQFLTPTERIMLAKRLSIAFLLAKDYDARMISRILKVSTTTVSTVNYWIKHNQGSLYHVIIRLLKKEKNEEFWGDLRYRIGKATIPLTTSNWSEKRKAIEQERAKHWEPF